MLLSKAKDLVPHHLALLHALEERVSSWYEPDYGDYYRGCAYCRLDDLILHFVFLFSFLKSCRTEESGVGDIFKEHASKFSEVFYIFGSFMDHMPIKIAPCVTYCAPSGPYILFILPLP